MLSVIRCRKLIGKESESMTDDQIEQVRCDLYQLAEMAFESWQKEKLDK